MSNSCATLWTIAFQAPLSMRFSSQEYWSGLPCPPPGDLPDSGIELTSLRSIFIGRWVSTSATREELTSCGQVGMHIEWWILISQQVGIPCLIAYVRVCIWETSLEVWMLATKFKNLKLVNTIKCIYEMNVSGAGSFWLTAHAGLELADSLLSLAPPGGYFSSLSQDLKETDNDLGSMWNSASVSWEPPLCQVLCCSLWEDVKEFLLCTYFWSTPRFRKDV